MILAEVLDVLAAQQVLGVEDAEEFRVLDEIVPGEAGKVAHRLGRIAVLQVELGLGRTDPDIGAFQDRDVERFLAAVVVVEHPLVDARPGRDLVDARSAKYPVR